MRITAEEGSGLNAGYQVELVSRTIADIRAVSGEAANEAFPQVAKISALNQTLYDLFASPAIRHMTTEATAEARRQMHPMRARRYMASDLNPAMLPFAAAAEQVKANRAPAAADNLFLAAERAMAERVEAAMDSWRDWRDAWTESAFHGVYGTLAAFGVAEASGEEAAAAAEDVLADAPGVRAALARIAEGSYAEAVVRMMVLLARARHRGSRGRAGGGTRRGGPGHAGTAAPGARPHAALIRSSSGKGASGIVVRRSTRHAHGTRGYRPDACSHPVRGGADGAPRPRLRLAAHLRFRCGTPPRCTRWAEAAPRRR
jgi:hypothetical protein